MIEWLASVLSAIEPSYENPHRYFISSRDRVVDNLFWLPFLTALFVGGALLERRQRSRYTRVLPYRRSPLDFLFGLSLFLLLILSTYVKVMM